MVGSLIYLINTRPKIVHVISVISRYIDKPNKSHLMAVMRILRYMKGTKNFSVKYKVKNDTKLIKYSNNNLVSYQDAKKSTS